ncbi:nucleotide-binding domain-containing protein [Butyrivibrio sp. INlla18]|uniref:nucleotide-binding domain-containing protein n=1 Tax=Butyrivibrio sp. INlla18 TaxID=1520806 RepID=UPI000B89ED0B|nr:nucleotidyltransferase domain-containing protein [Butyrivibrio sp. INlla18]
MSLSSDFKQFCKKIKLDDSAMRTTAGEIAKKLNKVYYDIIGEESDHMYIVGSVGRKTAIKGSSDLDLLFVLPQEIYDKYNGYESGGKSQLLQEVKKVLKERYPKTDISGDGQVVVIDFDAYTVELVPAFINDESSFIYPDTHDGGSWKITKPILEQEACNDFDDSSNGAFRDFTGILRAWKNNVGFSFSGLLIDTLVAEFFEDNDSFENATYYDYREMLLNLFSFLKEEDSNQSYWFALGSNQHVSDKGKGKFVEKAKQAYDKLVEANDNNINEVLRGILGYDFPKFEKDQQIYNYKKFRNTEEFIMDKFPVDIIYNLDIDCEVKQDGWRPNLLSKIIKTDGFLKIDKNLEFMIMSTDCPQPYDIYWKVRNVGREAEIRDDIRGQIVKGQTSHREHSLFKGPHYTECYLVKSGVCVAKARIAVPIKNQSTVT